ncbi:threonine synthase [Paenibacillus sp. NPDC057967]|uniref:threonine synthase n=1 Tax=Paenibacillus sp. NPDC057967 TaxID=3346293 RepID=UPI0036DD0C25
MPASGLRCIQCDCRLSLNPIYECPKCGGILEVYYDHAQLQDKTQLPLSQSYEWMPIRRETAISLGEGNTSLIEAGQLAKRLGLRRLLLKCEFTNPTGSFKDRPIAIGVAKAVEFGYRKVVVASSGNAAASVAAYAARAGLEAIILVPASTPGEKIMQTLAYGAKVIRVQGPYSNSFGLAKELSQSGELYNLTTTFYNPYTVEGDKMVGYEIFEQMKESPDAIYVPIGAGPLLVGTYKGFVDYQQTDGKVSLPRMVGVQAEGNNPIVKAFLSGSTIVGSEPAPNTIAGGIADGLVGYTKDGAFTLDVIRKSNGFAIDVSDARILEAKQWLAKDEGLFVEPSAAAAIAGVAKSLHEGQISSGDVVVAILTGHGLKDMNNLGPVEEAPIVDNSSEQLKKLLTI